MSTANTSDLILDHMQLVKNVALSRGKKYNFNLDQLEDLISSAMLALVFSANRYQKYRNIDLQHIYIKFWMDS